MLVQNDVSWCRQSWDATHLTSFDELDVIVPYFTTVFVLFNAVEHKFISLTDFAAVGQCIHASVDFNVQT